MIERRRGDPLLRFRLDSDTGCWLWLGGKTGTGYGEVKVDAGMVSAHRYFYTHVVGPVPSGLVLDHLCRTPACVNPDHVEPVTHTENKRRGISPVGDNARKTHCKVGHPFAGTNLRIDRRGTRICRRCKSDTQMRLYRKDPERYRAEARAYYHRPEVKARYQVKYLREKAARGAILP